MSENKHFDADPNNLPIASFFPSIVAQCMQTPQHYTCSKHKNERINFVCDLHKEFICVLCRFDHEDHKTSIRAYAEESFLSDLEVYEKKLIEMGQKIDNLKKISQDIKGKKIQESNDLKNFFMHAYKMIFTPFSPSLGDADMRFPLDAREETPNEIAKVPKGLEESALLKNAPNREFLKTLFDNMEFSGKLLYRGSKNEFSASKFHSVCDNKGPTLTLVKSKLGYFFGGFAATSWNASSQSYVASSASFLFSLNNKSKHEIYQNHGNALHSHPSNGPLFGGGHDLYISDGCNVNQNSAANLGHTYKSPHSYNSEESQKYLAGIYRFEVEDYEVFALNF